MEELVQYDTALFLYLNNLGTNTWDWFWLFMTNKYYQIPLYVVLLALLFKFYKKKEVLLLVLVVALLITCTDQTTNLFKNVLVMRWRPCLESGVAEHTRQILGRCIGYGYFSGHSSNSMALAVFLGLVLQAAFKNLRWVLLLWAVIVGYSRIYVGVHYPLDVLSGFACGALYGYLAYRLSLYLMARFS